jgi:hypothetical protein
MPPTIFFFFLGFNLILLTKRLMLAEYLIQFPPLVGAQGEASGAHPPAGPTGMADRGAFNRDAARFHDRTSRRAGRHSAEPGDKKRTDERKALK